MLLEPPPSPKGTYASSSSLACRRLRRLNAALRDRRSCRPPHQLLRNLPAEIENALPEAYLQCCSCTNASNWMPCRRVSDVVSPCMIRVAGPKKLATFLVERLGLFGSWHQFTSLPASVLNAREDGPSWCVNNCFNREFMQRLQLSSRVKPFIDSATAAATATGLPRARHTRARRRPCRQQRPRATARP